MANAIPTGIIDINGKPVYTGQTVRMHYFYQGLMDGSAIKCENEIEGIVRVQGYKYNERLFCVETQNKIRYPFKLMKKPRKQIEVIKDYCYAKYRLDKCKR